MVNHRLALHLNLPYLANTARMPFRDALLDVPRILTDELPSVMAADKHYAEAASNVKLMRGEPFIVPVFLAVALQKAQRPADLWAAIAELRSEAVGYRRRRVALEDAVSLGDLAVVTELQRALALHSSAWSERVIDASATASDSALIATSEAATSAHVAALPGSWQVVALTALIAGSRKLLPQELTRRLMWRFFKPEFRFLNRISDESKAIATAMPRVQRLWDVRDKDADEFVIRFTAFGDLVNDNRAHPDG
jgi:hypothetical protein